LIDRRDFFVPLHQHCRFTSLQIIQSRFQCISWIGIVENHAVQSFTCGLQRLSPSLLLTLAISKIGILNEATFTLPTPPSRVWPLPPSSTFKLWQRVRPPPGWWYQDWLLVVLRQFCRKLFISPILPSLPFVLILSLVVSFDLDLKLNYAIESISRLLRAHCPPCILH